MSIVVSAMGIHCIGGNRGAFKEFLDRIDSSGRRLSLVKCVDDFGAFDEPVALWPQVLTIGARTDWRDAPFDVDLAYRRITAEAARNPKAKYWEYFNEQNDQYQEQADFYIKLMPRLAAVNIGLCMFNSGSGTPQYPLFDPVPYREIARACAFARQNHFDVMLGLHEYVKNADTIGRFKALADYLEAHNALVPIAITEFGYETFPGVTKFMNMVKGNDTIYMNDKRVAGCALWTLGKRGWAGSDFQSALPQLGEYIATVEYDEPQPVTEHTFILEDNAAADSIKTMLDGGKIKYQYFKVTH